MRPFDSAQRSATHESDVAELIHASQTLLASFDQQDKATTDQDLNTAFSNFLLSINQLLPLIPGRTTGHIESTLNLALLLSDINTLHKKELHKPIYKPLLKMIGYYLVGSILLLTGLVVGIASLLSMLVITIALLLYPITGDMLGFVILILPTLICDLILVGIAGLGLGMAMLAEQCFIMGKTQLEQCTNNNPLQMVSKTLQQHGFFDALAFKNEGQSLTPLTLAALLGMAKKGSSASDSCFMRELEAFHRELGNPNEVLDESQISRLRDILTKHKASPRQDKQTALEQILSKNLCALTALNPSPSSVIDASSELIAAPHRTQPKPICLN